MKYILFILTLFSWTVFSQSTEHNLKGWKPDKGGVVDKSFGPRFVGTAIKPSVDLRKAEPSIYDQGQLGSCVGNGVAAVLDYIHSLGTMKFYTPSRLQLYYEGRKAINTINEDSGCQIRDVVAAALKVGGGSESLWPYDISKFTQKPSAACYADAAKHKALTAYKCESIDDVRRALSLGLPVVFGVQVYQGIQDMTYFHYTLPMPNPGERSIGGHCMVVVGYNNADSTLIIRNSWGKSWGRAGHMLMPFAYWQKFQKNIDAWVVSVVMK